MSAHLKPLCGVLDGVLDRLAAIEAQLGIQTTAAATSPAPSTSGASSAAVVEEEELHPRLVAYDEHVQRALVPFTDACTALGPDMASIGGHIADVWDGQRLLIALGTTYKRPMGDVAVALQPHLKPCQDAISKIRAARLDRKFDQHIKAIMEMLSCVSWVVISPPPSPSNFVKDTVGASDFWANKIRKEYRTNEIDGPAHLKFCDLMKALVNDLAAYLKEYHLSGLAWNPHGKDFSEAKVGEVGSSPKPAAAPKTAPAGGAGGAAIFDELKKKQTGDGASAATGLKKVTRDQQTWRKEYQKPGEDVPAPKAVAPVTVKPAVKAGAKPLGPPKCEYQDRGCKWNVENQTRDTCEGGVCKIEVTDPKQQVRKDVLRCEKTLFVCCIDPL
jgi:adenylyl cyclase-associated protein